MFALHLFALLIGCLATIAAAPFWPAQQQSAGSYAVAPPPPQQVAQQCCGNGRVLGQQQRSRYAGKEQQYANHQAGYEGRLQVAQQQNVAPQHPQPTGPIFRHLYEIFGFYGKILPENQVTVARLRPNTQLRQVDRVTVMEELTVVGVEVPCR